MNIKIILLFITIFTIVGCGSSQEPPSPTKTDPTSKSFGSFFVRDIEVLAKEDTNTTLNRQLFLSATKADKPLEGILITSIPTHGKLDINGTSLDINSTVSIDAIDYIKYQPQKDFFGSDTFEFKAIFLGRPLASAKLTFKVANVNDSPVFTLKSYAKSFEEKTIATDLNRSSSIISVDLNLDGKVDILTTSEDDGRVIWLENIDGKNFTEHNITTSLTTAKDIKASDMDMDGDIDLVVAGDKLSIFINSGQNFTETSIDANSSRAISIADIDSDGDMDIVSAEYSQNIIALYKNSNLAFTKEIVDNNISNPTDVEVFDKDRDGKKDIVASAYSDGLYWYKQTQNSFEKNIIYSYQDQRGTNSVTINDKIYSTNYDSETILEDNITLFSHYQPTSIQVGDLDGDGDDDLVLTSYSYSYLIWYENIDKTYKPHYIDKYSHAQSAVLADIDGDGLLEIIVAHKDESKITLFNSSDTVFVYENNISVTKIEAFDADKDKLHYQLLGEDACNFNIDENGVLEFKTAPDYEDPKDSDKNNMYNITINISDNSQSVKKDLRIVVQNLSYFSSKTVATNFQNIRDIAVKGNEIVVVDDNGLYTIDSNNTKHTIQTSYDYPMSLAIIQDKIVVGFETGYVAEYLLGVENEIDNDCYYAFKLLTSDLNDDNKTDIVTTCDDRVKWYKQESDGSFSTNVIGSGFASYTYDISKIGSDFFVSVPDESTIYKLKDDGSQNYTKEIFDDISTVSNLNSDANSIFAISTNTNTIYKYIGNIKSAINSGKNIAYPNSLEIADIDGDTKGDLVVTTKDDHKVLWYQNSTNYKSHLITITKKEPVKTKVVDIDGDGDMDIILATKESIFILYKNDKEESISTQ